MQISEKAEGIVLKGKNFTYIKAIKLPEADCKITEEIWFIGKAKDFQKKMKKKN